jgi:type I restriction enzyme S subunit
MNDLEPFTSRWPSERARYLFREINDRGYDLPLASVTRDGGVEFRADLDISVWNPGDDISNYKRVMPGDFVIGLRSFQSGLGCSLLEGLVSPAYSVLRPRRTDMLTGYFRHLLKSEIVISRLDNMAQGIRQGRTIAVDDFNELRLPLPPITVQRHIAGYLDRETARIDCLAVAKQRMVELLDEQRQAWLSEKIDDMTRNRPIMRLKYIARIQGGLTLGKQYEGSDVRAWSYLRVANVQAHRVDLTEVATIDLPISVASRHKLKIGDLLLAEGNGNPENLGRAVIWNGQIPDCLHQNHVFALRPSATIRSEYLEAVLATHRSRRHFHASASQVGIASISQEKVLDLPIPVPPLTGQDDFVARLSDYDEHTGSIRRHLARQIGLLRERRKALISTAVTGQLDVLETA